MAVVKVLVIVVAESVVVVAAVSAFIIVAAAIGTLLVQDNLLLPHLPPLRANVEKNE